MTKELEALDNLLKSVCFTENIEHKYLNLYEVKNSNDYKIIETALKDYERLLNLRKSAEWADEKLQTKKKLQALVIIKEKRVNVHLLLLSDSLEKYNFNLLPYRKLTQEEFDILKEVLL